jgi:hypothetical protein
MCDENVVLEEEEGFESSFSGGRASGIGGGGGPGHLSYTGRVDKPAKGVHILLHHHPAGQNKPHLGNF